MWESTYRSTESVAWIKSLGWGSECGTSLRKGSRAGIFLKVHISGINSNVTSRSELGMAMTMPEKLLELWTNVNFM